MKFSATFLAGLAATGALAYPGMDRTVKEVEIAARQQNGALSTELLGDLRTLADSKLSSSGRDIKNVITGKVSAESDSRSIFTLPLNGILCRLDTCCVWQYISNDLEALFRGESGLCTDLARKAIRMGFHDAGPWSKSREAEGGGADGSIILAGEMDRFENAAMAPMAAKYKEVYAKYHDKLGFRDVTMADLLQFGAKVATVVCPLGPRIKTWVGRKDSSTPAPELMLPSPFASAEELISMFQDKTITPRGLVALLGAHTTSQQTVVNVTRNGDPQDSTPGVWDTVYYRETLGSVPVPQRVMSFPSDLNLAAHPDTKPVFQEFSNLNQRGWNRDYAREYVRLSLLGVNNINSLKECTRVLPRTTTSFSNKDQSKFDKWLKSFDWSPISKLISDLINKGKPITVNEKEIPTKNPSKQ